MLTNLGIIASSLSGSRAPATFSYGGEVNPSQADYITFLNGTAIQSRSDSDGATSNWYSASVYTGSTSAGTSINTPYGLTAANGVALKFGRFSAGTVAIARSTDGGQNWTTVLNTASTGDYLIAGAYGSVGGTARWVSPVAGDNDVYLSTNNGSTWTAQSNVLGGTARTWCAATRYGTAFGVFRNGTDYYTSETGVTWTLRTLPVAPGHISFRNFVAGSAEVMYSANLGGGTVSTYTSTDLVNWTATGTVVFPFSITDNLLNLAFGNGYWVMMGGRETSVGNDQIGIAYSASAGTAWTLSTFTGGTTDTPSLTLSVQRDLAYNSADSGFYAIAGDRIWRAITV